MGLPSCGQLEPGSDNGLIEPVTAVAEGTMLPQMIANPLCQHWVNRHHPTPLRLRVHELEHPIAHPAYRQPLRFTPTAARHQTDHGDQPDMRVRHASQHLEEPVDLLCVEVRQFPLLQPDRAKQGERILELDFTEPPQLIEQRSQVGEFVVQRLRADACRDPLGAVLREIRCRGCMGPRWFMIEA